MLKHTEGEGLWLGGWMKEGERVNTDTNSVVIARGKWGGVGGSGQREVQKETLG